MHMANVLDSFKQGISIVNSTTVLSYYSSVNPGIQPDHSSMLTMLSASLKMDFSGITPLTLESG